MMANTVGLEVVAHSLASMTRMLTSYERREVLATDRLHFAEAIKKILRHVLELEEKRAMDNIVQLHVMNVTREVNAQYEIAELHLSLSERAKAAHLLQVKLDSALDDLELAHMQQQVVEARVAEHESMLSEERLERQRVQGCLRVVREEVQRERCERMQAQRDRDDMATALKGTEAGRVRVEKEGRAREAEMMTQMTRLQEQVVEMQRAAANREEGAQTRAVELEGRLACKLGEVKNLELANAAAQKDNKRLAQVVDEQRRELEVAEGEQMALSARADALAAELTTLRATHVALSAENGNLREACRAAGAERVEKGTKRKSRESPTRNLGGALAEAAPQHHRRGKPGAGKGGQPQAQAKRAGGGVPIALAGSPPRSSTAAIPAGADTRVEDASGGVGGRRDDQERRVLPRLKRPTSAESRQSGRPPGFAEGGVEKPSDREAKRAKGGHVQEASGASKAGVEQALRAPLQAVSVNTGGSSSQAEGSKAVKPKRTLAPSASKVLGKPPLRPESKSQFGKLFKKFTVPQMKLTSGTSSHEVDHAILMSP